MVAGGSWTTARVIPGRLGDRFHGPVHATVVANKPITETNPEEVTALITGAIETV